MREYIGRESVQNLHGLVCNFLIKDWKILRYVGKGKKVMLKCGCGIY